MCLDVFNLYLSLDAVYAFVQPSRQTTATKVVLCHARQSEEEDHSRFGGHHTDAEAENVQFSRMEGAQSCLQEVEIIESPLNHLM